MIICSCFPCISLITIISSSAISYWEVCWLKKINSSNLWWFYCCSIFYSTTSILFILDYEHPWYRKYKISLVLNQLIENFLKIKGLPIWLNSPLLLFFFGWQFLIIQESAEKSPPQIIFLIIYKIFVNICVFSRGFIRNFFFCFLLFVSFCLLPLKYKLYQNRDCINLFNLVSTETRTVNITVFDK